MPEVASGHSKASQAHAAPGLARNPWRAETGRTHRAVAWVRARAARRTGASFIRLAAFVVRVVAEQDGKSQRRASAKGP